MNDDGFDPVIHPLARLRICALLDPVRHEAFATVRDLLGFTDSTLSKHVRALIDAGYLEPTNAGRSGRRPVTLAMTRAGRVSFHRHIAALNHLAGTPKEANP